MYGSQGNREGNSLHGQSAMEYLMTYGWAILIVAVVLGALYSMGIFNGANFLGGTCVAAPGYLCSNPLMATDGTLSLTYGYQGPNVTVVGFACTNTTTAPSSFAPSGSSNLEPGQEESVSVSCPLPSGATIGTPYSGYLWVEYDQAGQSDLIAKFATIRTSASTEANDYLYCVNSVGGNTVNSVIVSGSSIGAWSPATASLSSIYGQQCVLSNNYIYCIGGGGTSALVSSSQVSGTSVGQWTATTSYPIQIAQQSCAASGEYAYCVGGTTPSGDTNAVISAQLSGGSVVGGWHVQSTSGNYPIPTRLQSCTISGGYIYCIGGYTASGFTASVYSAKLSGTTVGPWQPTTNYVEPMGYDDCVASNGYIYCIGGWWPYYPNFVVPFVYSTKVSDGSVLGWEQTTNYPTKIWLVSCNANNNYLYCVGGQTDTSTTANVYVAALSGNSVINWVQQANYYSPVSNPSCVYD